MAIEPGKSVGHYKIVSKIGSGGMGEVYLAGDTKLERRVAIKFLHEELSKDADKLNRFIQEAKAASALNHPNILTVYEIGEADGQNYIATELIDGKTLRAHLAGKEDVPLNSILKIGVQVAEALSAAHQAGIIHRDIKPENIMLRSDGYAKVLDFGLAKLSEPPVGGQSAGSEDATRAQVNTTPGMVMGTASYMSPEQARGNPTDARTDIWSLGIVLYEMLAGKVPFSGETVNHTIVAILEKEPLLLENVPHELQRIVRKSLTKDVDMRYQSARDLLIDLKNLRRDLDIQGELERSIIPNREPLSQTSGESETQFYTGGAERTVSGQMSATQNLTSGSSLEYAVTQARSHKAVTAVVGILLVGVIGAVAYFGFLARSASGQINSIAVLPFENRSDDPNADYLSDGLAESLIYRLSQLPNLKVSPTSSVMRYKGKGGNLATIASELGVQAVLTGRVVQRADNLSISVELIDTANNKVLWGEQYEKKMADLLATQREIATAIVDKLQLKLSGTETAGIIKKYTDSSEAYQLYLKGRHQWNKRTVEGLKAAEAFYKEAVERDPSFALAYSGLAETYVLFSNYSVTSPREASPKAKAAATKAIELDPTLAEPHAALALYDSLYAWDLEAAVRKLERAIELNPKYATAYHWLGNGFPPLNRCDDAVAAGRRAEELDPLSPIISADTGWDMVMCRRFDDALAQTQKALKIEPNFYYTHMVGGWAYLNKKNYNEAVTSLRRAIELNDDPFTKAILIQALAKAGERAEAGKLLGELRADSSRRFIDNYVIAMAEVGLGENDAAIRSIEKCLVERGAYAPYIAVDPAMDDLRNDPRFPALVKKIQASKLE